MIHTQTSLQLAICEARQLFFTGMCEMAQYRPGSNPAILTNLNFTVMKVYVIQFDMFVDGRQIFARWDMTAENMQWNIDNRIAVYAPDDATEAIEGSALYELVDGEWKCINSNFINL